MTEVQHKCLTFIIAFIKKHGFSPNFDEVAAHLGVVKSGAYRVIHALARDGLITFSKGSARSIRPIGPSLAVEYASLCARFGPEAVRAEAIR